MNENMRGYYNDEKEIDLVDLMFYLLRQWKTLAITIVIGALIGSGIYMVKRPVPTEDKALMEEESGEEYEVDPDVEANMELAFQYRQLYRKQLKYNQESVIMQLNPNSIYSGEVRFYISAGYDTGLIGVLYQDILNDEELQEAIANASGLDCKTEHVKELVGSYVSQDNDSFINVNNMDAEGESSSSVVRHSFIVFTAISSNEKSCRRMLETIREKVEELDQEFKETYEDYSFFEVNSSVRLVTDNSYLNRQRESVDLLSAYLSNVQRLESSFAEDDLAYYNKIFLAKEYGKIEEGDSEERVLGIADSEEEENPESPWKWLAIGIFLACVCWGGYYLIKYLLDKHIKTAEEVVSCYNLPLIGKIAVAGDEGKGLSGYLDRLYRRWKGKADTDDYIVSTVDALDAQRILVCGDTRDMETQNLMRTLEERCGKVESGGLLSKDADMLKKTKAADCIVLLVRVGQTKYSELQRELDVCWMQQIAVKGVVALDVL